MTVLDEYIVRAAQTLRDATASDMDALCHDISDILKPDYTPARAWACLGGGEGFSYTKSDLGRMLAILRLRREEQDRETYGGSGLLAITQHIRQLERANEDGLCGDQLIAVYEKVDSIYANYYDSYADGLSGYSYRGYEPCLQQTELRMEKLKLFRDEELRRLRIAEAQAASVSMVQNATASASTNIQITLETTFEQIERLPEAILSDDDKTLLKGMIGDLNTKDKKKRNGTLGKLQAWLADKGTDVFIAVIPYIAQLIQPQLV
ncbi:hypothetical protein ACTQZK_07265 [Paraeggerthella sp. LCP19S3_G8]|uniref:hypothetical protein n=1 Tax=Paraeggerthella sp. LCP19S3_G8 TaxID=3440248 RepID=UPI003F9DB3D7